MVINTRPIVTRAEAKASGSTRYFTGKPCKYGHLAERTTINGECAECYRAKKRKYRAANIDAALAADREYQRNRRASHPAAARERDRKRLATAEWRQRKQEADRKSYAKRRLAILAQRRERFATNREVTKARVARAIMLAASLQPTNETRRAFALWILDQSDPAIRDAVKIGAVDQFLTDFTGI
jgi:hypothetical protein